MFGLKIRGGIKIDNLEIPEDASIKDLKLVLFREVNNPNAQLKLVSAGRILKDDDEKLKDAGIKDGKTIMVTITYDTVIESQMRQEQIVTESQRMIDEAMKIAERFSKSAKNLQVSPDDNSSESQFDERKDLNLEITDQEGRVMYIPPDQKKALLEGMFLHDRAKGLLRKAQKESRNEIKGEEQFATYSQALILLTQSEKCFRECEVSLLNCIDNYAYVCLDIVWVLFLLRELNQLDLASDLLQRAENCFERVHGKNLERLTALKGFYYAEKIVYVRLHLLQAVVAFYKGELNLASNLILRAREECNAMEIKHESVQIVMENGSALLDTFIDSTMAIRALRSAGGDIQGAINFLERRKERLERIENEEKIRRELGKTKNGEYVHPGLVEKLTNLGFERKKVIKSLRESNNDGDKAYEKLLTRIENDNPISEESIAFLCSMGFEQTNAIEALKRANQNIESAIEILMTGEITNDSNVVNNLALNEEVALNNDIETNENDQSTTESKENEIFTNDNELHQILEDFKNDIDSDDEAHLDISLEDEKKGIETYFQLCFGNIPPSNQK